MSVPIESLPRSWPKLSQSHIFIEQACRRVLDSLTNFDPSLSERLIGFDLKDTATSLVEHFDQHSELSHFSQIVIVSNSVSPTITALALLSLEQGYTVFVVLHEGTVDNPMTISRLQTFGIIMMTSHEYLNEVSYAFE